jgi:hypothetical protein
LDPSRRELVFSAFSDVWGAVGEQLRFLHCGEGVRKALHRGNRFDRRRLDVVLPGHTVIAVAKDHSRDCFSYSNALKIGREPSPEPVPTFPFNASVFKRLFHLTVVQRIEVNGLPDAIREDWANCRIAASLSMFFEKFSQLRD